MIGLLQIVGHNYFCYTVESGVFGNKNVPHAGKL